MKQRNRLAPVALAFTLAAATLMQSCAQTNTPAVAPAAPADTRAADEAAIRANSIAGSSATESKDVDKAVSFYAPDAVVLNDGGPVTSDPAKIRAGYQGLADDKNG